MNDFKKYYFNSLIKYSLLKESKKHLKSTIREKIEGFRKSYLFDVGDVLEVIFFRKTVPIIFKVFFLSKKKKKILDPNSAFKLRNVLLGVGIELTCSFYSNRLYNFKFYDYRRKMYFIRSSKIYFIRSGINKESKIGDTN
jgi:ribosomal protein L19